jgi:hypothetical protein
VIQSRLRLAAGVCVLAAGLLMSEAAVAVAVPGLGGGDGTDTSGDGGSTSGGPVGSITDTVTDTVKSTVQGVTSTVQGVMSTPGSNTQPGQQPSAGPTSTLGSGRQPGQRPSPGATSLTPRAGQTVTEFPANGGLVPAHTNPIAAAPNVVPPGTGVVASITELVPPVTNVITPATDVAPPVTNVIAPVIDVVTPVTEVVAPVIDVVTPVTDVIAPGQDILTSVLDAFVPPMQSPSDLSSFLLGIAGMAPAKDGLAGAHNPGVAASTESPVPLGPSIAGITDVPVAGNATRVITLDVITLSRVSALSGMPPAAPNAVFPMGEESSYAGVLAELLLIASLWTMAAIALPGIGGIVVLTAIGVRIGYGGPNPNSHRGRRVLRASPVLGAVKRWMSSL